MATYYIKGSTLSAIAEALREVGGTYDPISVSGMPAYISANLLSQGVYDNLISNPGTSSAKEVLRYPSSTVDISTIYAIDGNTLINIVNALRAKKHFPEKITATQIPDYIKNKIITQEDINALINKTLTYIYNSTCTTIGATAFQDCTRLSYAEFTNVTTAGANAFQGCVVLNDISMPKCTTVGTDIFASCTNIKNMTLGITSIESTDSVGKIIYKNGNIRKLVFPNLVSMYSSVCQQCYSLSYISAPNLDTLTQNAFYQCSSLTEINFPKCGTTTDWGVGANCFNGCIALKKVSLPAIISTNGGAFANCTSLEEFYAPKLVGHKSANTVFSKVTSLKKITVGYPTVPNLFAGQTNLTYFSDSSATDLAEGAFLGCTALNENGIHLSRLATITANSAFNNTGFVNITPSTFPAFTGSISHYTFQNCASLKSVNFPGPVYLGRDVFGSCNALTYLSMPNVTSVYTKSNYTPISRTANLSFINFNALLSIPYNFATNKTKLATAYFNGATTIAKSAFLGCTSLKSVYLNAATTLTEDTFKNCTALTLNSCNFGAALSLIGVTAFEGCTGITSITNAHFPYNSNVATFTVGVQAFLNCTGLTTINNSTITNLSKSAFQGCTALTTVNLPKLALIADETVPFSGCTNLKTVSLAKATTLGINAFSNITTLTSISIPACTTLSNYALYNTGLTSFYGPKVTHMNGYVFQNTPITTISLPLCSYVGKYALSNATLQSINMPAWNSYHKSGVFSAARTTTLRYMNVGFTAIPKYFSNCANLSTVIANECTALVQSQFLNCAALTTISFPVCATVASNAFQGCAALAAAEFPAATKISANAFKGCTNLSTLRLANGALCALQNSNAFTGTKITTTTGSIYVPTAWVASYKAAKNWKTFATQIIGF